MPNVTFFKPTDPPKGQRRFLEELRNGLCSTQFDTLYISVAFAKVGPLLRLISELENWRKGEKKVFSIYGIDLKGTSVQALDFSQNMFNEVYITHNPSFTTFHPKIYLFKGTNSARAYIGSQNMTVGGMELNFESGVRIDMDLPAEIGDWNGAFSCWECLLPNNCVNTKRLTKVLFNRLVKSNLLFDETAQKSRGKAGTALQSGLNASSLFQSSPPVPPSSVRLPNKYKRKPTPKQIKAKTLPIISPTVTSTFQSLAIQIIPHHNGEIFLSKGALNQSPTFFGYPFTGKTTPKKASNPSYPMRNPDPSVTLTLYDNKGAPIHQENIPNLNMVYYTRKSDIRITINPTIASTIPPYSILVMTRTQPTSLLDYELHVYFPGSPMYNLYYAQCDQTLPSGGKAVARKMGWL